MVNRLMKWFKELDRILRGDATQLETLEREELKIPIGGLSLVIVMLAVLYGLCMGFYSLFREEGPGSMQVLASVIKVPLLFLLTLLVTFPSLYVSNALVGSRLNMRAVLRLAIAAMSVNLAVLASLGPIVAFFSASTKSYSFMVLLNVVVFAVAGVLGFSFMLQTLNRLTIARRKSQIQPPPISNTGEVSAESASTQTKEDEESWPVAELAEEPSALDSLRDYEMEKRVKSIFTCWIIVFGFVGAQMSWVLRPFIGSPGTPFEWFRPRGSNFFEAVLKTIANLFS